MAKTMAKQAGTANKAASKKTTTKVAGEATGKKVAKAAGKTTGKKVAKAASKTSAKQVAKAASKTTGKKVAKAAGKTTAKAVSKTTAKKVAKAAGKTAAKKVAKAASKTTAKKVAKAAGKATAKKVAKAAGKTTAKKVAKAAGSAGATVRFEDPGLHLAVFGALLDDGVISADALTRALAGVLEDGEEWERIPDAVGRLHAIGLDAAAVAGLTDLDFDGGNEVYMALEQALDVDTGGELEYYELHSLAGIEQLTRLTSLSLDGHGFRDKDLDLTPLAGHPALQSLRLSGRCVQAGALETLPQLRSLVAAPRNVDDEAVLARLAARGVAVTGG